MHFDKFVLLVNIRGNNMKKKNKAKKSHCYCSLLPHVLVSIIIFSAACVSLVAAMILHNLTLEFASSILANIFAGLITGLIICLISGIKQKTTVDINEKKEWLQKLSVLIKIYFADYDKLVRLKFDKFNGDENLYIFFYDAHTHANDVNTEILQRQFDKNIDFSPRDYCKETLHYDAEALIDAFEDLHIFVEHIDIDCPSSKEILAHFNTVHTKLKALNSSIYIEIRELDDKLSKMHKSIL